MLNARKSLILEGSVIKEEIVKLTILNPNSYIEWATFEENSLILED